MSGKKKTSLTRIRTYAQDRDALQNNTPAPAVPKADTVTVVTPVTKAAPKPTPAAPAPVVFPPLQKTEEVETPLSEIEKSFSKPEIPTIPKHIPAFHELTKELEHDLNPPTPPPVSTPKPVVPPKQPIVNPAPIIAPQREAVALSGGTVITDTKRTDFNFFTSVATAINEFFTSIQEVFKPKKSSQTYTVTAPDRRKGVVQKATSKTGTLFTADNETLKEAILRRQREEKAKKDITWSPQTEPGYPLLEEPTKPTITNVVVTFKQPIAETPISQRQEVEEPTRWEDAPTTLITRVPTPPITVIPTKPVPPTPPLPAEPVSSRINTVTKPTPIPAAPVAPAPIIKTAPAPEVSVVPPPPTETKKQPGTAQIVKKPKFLAKHPKTPKIPQIPIRLTELRSNIIALTATGIIIGIIVVTISIRGLYGSFAPVETTDLSTIQSVALLRNATQGAVVIPVTGINSVSQIITAATNNQTEGITEIRLLDTNQQELSPQAILTLLETETNPNFNQAITSLRVLGINRDASGLLFAVTNPTTVFGAMLQWEQNMYANLGSIISTSPVTGTGSFVDRTIGPTDVRILIINDTEVLTYGFIDRNLLLITTTSQHFTEVLETL